ncbi:hydrogenase formation protein HypD [Desulfosporosinus lacus]|uniref:Hydrogenase expression/formation protein HypD n=1 Tax=Desulfosporosinus lacus DSM 15449 TaxID=1121420 RepID=A0A1M5Z2I2_9FIRM|nr:hydrogenase formation protein HypD [Desulfosporosinus lacus]SHI18409.1 hydrogenase expression/formation protein HypD [Desulfosporosinus lacus DSM 15449]
MKKTSKELMARASILLTEIKSLAQSPFTIMEVCGTHTVAIAKNALRELLPSTVRLVSGPGCPVCVTASGDIDRYLYLAAQKNVLTATFGDMIRVPGTEKNLQELRAEGADIRVVYSTQDALELARQNPDKEVVFLGIGFETTVPTVAVSLEIAKREGIKNYSVLSMHKVVPPVLKLLAEDKELVVDAFLDPGHVCSIIGIEPIKFMAQDYGKPGVVTGFEALDILEGIVMLLRQRAEGRSDIEIQYHRVAKPEGNPQAKMFIERVFEPVDASWRGIGLIRQSGLGIRGEYRLWDAVEKFSLPVFDSRETPGCRCGDVLRGIIYPTECPLFGKHCTPMKPVGPCMVSTEGSCAAYHRYAQRSVD